MYRYIITNMYYISNIYEIIQFNIKIKNKKIPKS